MIGFNFLFIVFFVLFFAVFIYTIAMNTSIVIKKNAERKKNDASPKLTVPVKVVSKRMRVETRHRTNQQHMSSIYDRTFYYVTFEFESGDRSEFMLSGEEYGIIAEGDNGSLTFQGTRFISFERNVD